MDQPGKVISSLKSDTDTRQARCGWKSLSVEFTVHSSHMVSFYKLLIAFDFVCVCVCVFIKLHITAQSGLVILVILCHSRCVCVCIY